MILQALAREILRGQEASQLILAFAVRSMNFFDIMVVQTIDNTYQGVCRNTERCTNLGTVAKVTRDFT